MNNPNSRALVLVQEEQGRAVINQNRSIFNGSGSGNDDLIGSRVVVRLATSPYSTKTSKSNTVMPAKGFASSQSMSGHGKQSNGDNLMDPCTEVAQVVIQAFPEIGEEVNE
jgi:hypothetical protein